MASLNELRNNFKRLQGKEIDLAALAFEENEELIEDLNTDQLYDGKDAKGRDLSPTYLEDPYFKTPEAAQRYSDWKDRITPNPDRKKGVPNLFINGRFHDSISVEVSKKSIKFSSSDSSAFKIESKFTNDIYGTTDESKKELFKVVKPAFLKKIKEFVKL